MDNRRTGIRNKISVMVGLALGASGPWAAAQGTGAGAQGLEEIVVTARKRSESIQDAPLSILAFSETQLEQRGIRDMTDLAKFAPGLTFNAGTTRASSTFSVRGMTQISATGDNRRDLVTIFLDGVPLVGSPSTFGAEDLARVEVVKGPQSALFGRATFGGAVSLVTTTPDNEFAGKASVTAGSYGLLRATGSLEGPIVEDMLSAKLVVDANQFDGFYKNDFGGRLGETEGLYVSGTLNFTPTENLSLRLRYSDKHDEDGPLATPLIARFDQHNCGPFPGFTPRPLAGLPAGFTLEQARRAYCGPLQAPSGPIAINNALPTASLGRLPFDDHRVEIDHDLFSATGEYSFGNGYSLTAIASTQEHRVFGTWDFERAPQDRYQVYANILQTQDTYEVRLTSPAESNLTWMVGVARLDATFDNIGAFINGTLFGPAAGGPAPAALNPARSSSETDSIFGSIGYNLTDDLNISVEARRQKDTITSGIGLPTEFDIETTATLPRVLLRYATSDETNVYANYAKGNQPTQGYATFFQLTSAQQEVALRNGVSPTAPEAEVENFELGIKHRAADGSWYLNASIYYLEWVGRQGVRSIQVDLNGDGVIQNQAAPVGENFNAVPFAAGDSNTKGFEIDGALSLTDHITVGGSAAYANTEITKALNESLPFRFFGLIDAAGFEFPLVPKWSGAAYLQYESAPDAEEGWFARTDLTYIGRRFDSIVNFAYVPTQVRVNLRGGLRRKNWELVGFVNNLFDDDTLEASRYQSDSATDPFFFQLAASEAVLANRQQVGVTLTYRF